MSISLSFHKVQAYWKNHSNRSRLRRERTLVRYASFLSFAAFNKTNDLLPHGQVIVADFGYSVLCIVALLLPKL